jgi:23S rRNA pseudouridine2604 synthase
MSGAPGIRINKYLSEAGFCSRRAADRLLEQGRITLNGVKPELGTKVMPGDQVQVDGQAVGQPTAPEEHVYIVYHKPVGIVCTTDNKREKDNIVDAIGHERRIFPVGRLDKPSEGLIFLTSDGDIVNKVLRARNHHEKEYHVTVDRPIRGDFMEDMAGGVPILGTVTRRCEVEQTGPRQFRIVLTQGLNRQIRRMCEHLGYQVERLKRVRIMHMHLDLPLGEWRDFTEAELTELREMVSGSDKTADFDSSTGP